jgi:hypothetical protein
MARHIPMRKKIILCNPTCICEVLVLECMANWGSWSGTLIWLIGFCAPASEALFRCEVPLLFFSPIQIELLRSMFPGQALCGHYSHVPDSPISLLPQ